MPNEVFESFLAVLICFQYLIPYMSDVPNDEFESFLTLLICFQYLIPYISDVQNEVFESFLTHLSGCAVAYRGTVEQDARRMVLSNLFLSCDHSGVRIFLRVRHPFLRVVQTYNY